MDTISEKAAYGTKEEIGIAKQAKYDSELIDTIHELAALIDLNWMVVDDLGNKLSPLRSSLPTAEGAETETWKPIYDTPAGQLLLDLQHKVQFNNDYINRIKNETRI